MKSANKFITKSGSRPSSAVSSPSQSFKVQMEKKLPPLETKSKWVKPKKTVSDVELKKKQPDPDPPVVRKKKRPDEVTEVPRKKKRIRPDEDSFQTPTEVSAPKKKKKRVVDSPVVEEKPTKKKKSRDLIPVNKYTVGETPPLRSKRNQEEEQLVSIFGDYSQVIIDKLEFNDRDGAVSLIYKRMLQTLTDILPYAESAVRKTFGHRGVYQINALISSMRELMQDMQSAQDRGMMGQALVEKIIRPSYLDIAMQVVASYSNLKTDAKTRMTPDDYRLFERAVSSTQEVVGQFIMQQYEATQKETIQFFQ